MKTTESKGLDFIIDKLTNSIENVVTGDSFSTDVSIIGSSDLKFITDKNIWVFDWKNEIKHPERDVYKLSIVNNQSVIQGLISLEIRPDNVYIHLIESASFNKGKSKTYSGVPGNLVAFACKLSFQRGHDGYVSFIAKTKLIEHYVKTLEATHIHDGLMIIETKSALILLNRYFGEDQK